MAKKKVKKTAKKEPAITVAEVVQKRSGVEHISNEQAIVDVMMAVAETNARISRIVAAISTAKPITKNM